MSGDVSLCVSRLSVERQSLPRDATIAGMAGVCLSVCHKPVFHGRNVWTDRAGFGRKASFNKDEN